MATFAIEAVTTQEQPRQRGKCSDHIERAITAGYATLARVMVRQAIKDAMQRHNADLAEEAAAWLGSRDGLEIAELSGFDAELIKRWYLSGCPAKTERMIGKGK